MELAHTWKLFLMTINLPRGCLAPPSAPHAGALALAGATPADGEGVGEARTGRSCLYGMFAPATGGRDEILGSSGVWGKGSPMRCQARAWAAEGQSRNGVPQKSPSQPPHEHLKWV